MRSSCCNAPIEEKFNNGRGAKLCSKCRQIRTQEDERRDSQRRDEENMSAIVTTMLAATIICM